MGNYVIEQLSVELTLFEYSRFGFDMTGKFKFDATAQRYLSRIHCGNRQPLSHDEEAPTNANAWLFEVIFDYGEYAAPPEKEGLHATKAPAPCQPGSWTVRPDPFSSYRADFEVRTYRLCRRIMLFHHIPEELIVTPCLVSSTDLYYENHPTVTYLKSIVQAGYEWDEAFGEYIRASLPSLELTYTQAPQQLDEAIQTIDRESLTGIPSEVDGSFHQKTNCFHACKYHSLWI